MLCILYIEDIGSVCHYIKRIGSVREDKSGFCKLVIMI